MFNQSAEQSKYLLREQLHVLQQRYEMVEQLTETSIDCVVAFDINENIIYWNKACSDYFDIDWEEVLNKPFNSVFPPNERNKKLRTGFIDAKAGRKVFLPSQQDAWLPSHFEIHLVP